jgi:hypothetical protein
MSDLFQNMSDIFFAPPETLSETALERPTNADTILRCCKTGEESFAFCRGLRKIICKFTARRSALFRGNPYFCKICLTPYAFPLLSDGKRAYFCCHDIKDFKKNMP